MCLVIVAVLAVNDWEVTADGFRANLALERISTEITERVNADTSLGTRIDNETTARTREDTALGTRIDNEITARENADTALGGRIDTEATTRENADTALDTRVDSLEHHAFIDPDYWLRDNSARTFVVHIEEPPTGANRIRLNNPYPHLLS